MNINKKTALIVVDFQGGDSLDEEIPGDPWCYIDQRDRAVEIIDRCRQKRVPVIFIQEVHKPHMVDIGRELDGSEGPHCIEGKNTTELARGIKPMADEYLIQKRRYSAFFGTDLEVLLKCYGVDSVILIGGFTDICVRYTAVDAHQYNYFINVVTDCVSGSSKRAHDDALENIHYLQSRSLVTTQETLDWLDTLVVEN